MSSEGTVSLVKPRTTGILHGDKVLADVLKDILNKQSTSHRAVDGRASVRGNSYSSITVNVFTEADRQAAKLDPSDVVYYRLPSILRTPNGILHVVAAELHYGLYDMGTTDYERINLVYKSSRDNGVTWSERKVLADFGGVYQNSEPSILYSAADDSIYIFFTSCKGKLGWGYSQAGTTDPNLSSQIYFMKKPLLTEVWSDPVNITTQVKEDDVAFIFTAPCKPVALDSGDLLIPLATVTGSSVTSWVMVFNEGINKGLFKVTMADRDTGGEMGLHVTPGGDIIAHARAYGNTSTGEGRQVIYKSTDGMLTWTKISEFRTVDSKGDMALVVDPRDSGRPVWILSAANGPNDDGLGDRSNQRIFVSHDLTNWRATPRTGLRNAVVGYIGLAAGSYNDEIVTATEVVGFTGIVFTSFSQSYWRELLVAGEAGVLKRTLISHQNALLSSGAIKNGELYELADRGVVALNNNGAALHLAYKTPTINLGVNDTATTIDVTGKSIVMINAGTAELHGMTGGVIGQEVTIASSGSVAIRNLVHTTAADASVPSTARFHFVRPAGFTRLQVRNSTCICVRAVLTQYGWFISTPANLA